MRRLPLPRRLCGSRCYSTHAPLYPYVDYTRHRQRVYYTADYEKADKMARIMLMNCEKFPLIALDSEWSTPFPFARPYKQRPLALLQLCDRTAILLLHLHHMHAVPEHVRLLLETEEIVKMGVNVRIDAKKLHDLGIKAKGMCEASRLCREVKEHGYLHHDGVGNAGGDGDVDKGGYDRGQNLGGKLLANKGVFGHRRPIISLKSLSRVMLGQELAKDQHARLSNWEMRYLTPQQKEYAANDVFATYLISNAIIKEQVLPPYHLEVFGYDGDAIRVQKSGHGTLREHLAECSRRLSERRRADTLREMEAAAAATAADLSK
ncbi:uncharacterized protein VTP21DRAFT_751 [Calcarisporiella thermophila]|uniref:uncharacterized protein n=1 Tax=Calcarisporiella thermophila TaxID=911321 RepID=UPI0037446FD9